VGGSGPAPAKRRNIVRQYNYGTNNLNHTSQIFRYSAGLRGLNIIATQYPSLWPKVIRAPHHLCGDLNTQVKVVYYIIRLNLKKYVLLKQRNYGYITTQVMKILRKFSWIWRRVDVSPSRRRTASTLRCNRSNATSEACAPPLDERHIPQLGRESAIAGNRWG
jgi:hypothetical protein